METEEKAVLDCVRQLQQKLARSIDVRNIQDCRLVIEKLSSPKVSAQYPSALSSYLSPHPQLSPLQHTIAKGHEDIALLLLRYGCDPYFDTGTNRCPGIKGRDVKMCKLVFRVLEKHGFETVFQVMLEKSEKLMVDKNGDTVLHVIVKKRLSSMFEVVLCSKWLLPMLGHFNNQGFLPMHVAANSNFLPFFQVLFQSKSVSDKVDEPYREHCHLSSLGELDGRNKDIGKALNINTAVKSTKSTVLHLTASERYVPMVELLIGLGANVNATDSSGKTPLVECLDQKGEKKVPFSSAYNLLQVCTLLINAGANVNVKSNIQYSERRSMANDDVLTPLHLAAGIGAKDIIELLLNNGADPKHLSGDIGKIPLQFALEQCHNEAALALLKPEIYPEAFLGNHLDYAFNSLLHSAGGCNSQVIKKLIQLSCPLDRPNVNRLRPLDKAISSKNIEFIELLLTAQPRIVNVHLYQDPTAYPPLHLAASSDDIRLCQILLSHGADIYARAYGKHMAYRKAFKFNRYKTGVYLCEQMSKPFSLAESEELTTQTLDDPILDARLKHRLEEIPSLLSLCLDSVRQTFIRSHLSFKGMHMLPVPETIIKTLKYQHHV